MALEAYDAREWCEVEDESGCPDAVNQTIAKIADYVVHARTVDCENCDSVYLSTSLCFVESHAAVWAIASAEATFKMHHLSPVGDGEVNLRHAIWLLNKDDRGARSKSHRWIMRSTNSN